MFSVLIHHKAIIKISSVIVIFFIRYISLFNDRDNHINNPLLHLLTAALEVDIVNVL